MKKFLIALTVLTIAVIKEIIRPEEDGDSGI